jgi:hypothetical protein
MGIRRYFVRFIGIQCEQRSYCETAGKNDNGWSKFLSRSKAGKAEKAKTGEAEAQALTTQGTKEHQGNAARASFGSSVFNRRLL